MEKTDACAMLLLYRVLIIEIVYACMSVELVGLALLSVIAKYGEITNRWLHVGGISCDR